MRLGPYEIVSRLGIGGMGEVYRARDTRLGRTVAIKVLSSAFSNDPERQERFRREARAISQLAHPHVCALYDIGQHEGLDYLVMEYLEGDTLQHRLRRGPLPLGLLLQIAMDITEALAWSHQQGIAHRDLKPSNIVLTATGAKLLDFGIAAFSPTEVSVPANDEPTGSLTLTKPGTVLGTVQYMSPEQVEGKPGDFRSDIFALGILLYEMATGKLPFHGDTSAAIMAAVLKSEPPAIGNPVPADLDRLVQACLTKDPNQRWQSAQDVKIELQWIERSQAEAPQEGRRFRNWGLVTIAALVLALIGGILLGYPRRVPATEVVRLRSSLLPPPGTSYEAYGFALSPDGTRLASVAVSSEGQTSLYVRSLSSLATQMFPGTAGASYPFWSPNSRRVGFFAEGHLKYVDTTTGNVQIIAEAPLGLGGTWNQDDVIVFASAVAGPLLRVSASGGSTSPVTTITGGGGHRWPWFLPNGRQFLYCEDRRTANNPHGNGIFLGSLDSSRARLISQDLPCDTEYASGHLFFVSDRNLMAQPFDAKRAVITGSAVPLVEQEIETDPAFGKSGLTTATNGEVVFQSATDLASRLMWFDARGKPLGRITETGLKDPRLSPDGHRLAVTSDDAHNGNHFIRVYDLARGVSTRVTDSGQEEFPVWSPDGTSIVYMGHHGTTACLCRVPADSSSAPITLLQGALSPNDWHGRWIAYMDFEKGFPAVWVYDVDRGDRRLIGGGAEAQFSPDGKWISFVHGLPGQNAQVYVQAFPGPGPRIQVSSRGGGQAQWSPDGRRLYYMAPDRKLMAVELQLRNGDAKASAPRVLFQTRITAPHIALFQFAVSPDGRFLINSLPTESPGPLTLLTNTLSNQ